MAAFQLHMMLEQDPASAAPPPVLHPCLCCTPASATAHPLLTNGLSPSIESVAAMSLCLSLSWGGVSPPSTDSSRAAAPDTMAADMLMPDREVWLLLGMVDCTMNPGAAEQGGAELHLEKRYA